MFEPVSRPNPALSAANRGLSWFHRWTGVALCLLFLMWFASGAVLAFVPFPSLSDQDRLAGADVLQLNSVRLTPSAALAAAGGGDKLVLETASGRPLYRVQNGDAPFRTVDAATGLVDPEVTAGEARTAASAFAHGAAGAPVGPFRYDQWVVHQAFNPWRPFYRVPIDDGAGAELYVSARTGEIVQRTRGAERAWNWAGAVVHWLYFTALRQSFTAWDQTVWWVSLLGLTSAVVGTWLGVYRTLQRMKGRRPDWSPFRGWLRWHHGGGLGVALFVLTWIFSGWLSMDHGRLFSRGVADPAAIALYQGASLETALKSAPTGALARLGSARRITFTVVDGRPIATAEGGPSGAKVILLDSPGDPVRSAAPAALWMAAAGRAWPLAGAKQHGPEASDALYRLADDIPARAIRLALNRPKGASVYIDPVTGQVLTLMDDSRKAYAWVYFAVHTFNFPILINRPILRRTVEMIPLAFGFVFSLTGLVIAVKRLRIAAAR